MKIIKHKEYKSKIIKMNCDSELSKKLNDDAILKNMNKSFFCSFIGKPGSGKSSKLLQLLNSRKGYKKVFNQVFVFMPLTSRMSIDNNIYEKELPSNQLYEGITLSDLNEVFEKTKQNSEDKKNSLIIFDDIQTYLKEPSIEKLFLHMIANRRHLKISIFLCCQTYNKLGKNIRLLLTDLFLFNLSKDEYIKIEDEIITTSKENFQNVLKFYKIEKKINKYSFIYINLENDIFFVNYNEINFDDDI